MKSKKQETPVKNRRLDGYAFGSIFEFAHCKQYKCERFCVEFYNKHLMSQINNLKSWERK